MQFYGIHVAIVCSNKRSELNAAPRERPLSGDKETVALSMINSQNSARSGHFSCPYY